MLIKVKTLTGKEIEIDIEPTDKVERIKGEGSHSEWERVDSYYWPFLERVEEKEGIPPPQQRLIFSGKQMNDEKTAADYKVKTKSPGNFLFLNKIFVRFKADQFFTSS